MWKWIFCIVLVVVYQDDKEDIFPLRTVLEILFAVISDVTLKRSTVIDNFLVSLIGDTAESAVVFNFFALITFALY